MLKLHRRSTIKMSAAGVAGLGHAAGDPRMKVLGAADSQMVVTVPPEHLRRLAVAIRNFRILTGLKIFLKLGALQPGGSSSLLKNLEIDVYSLLRVRVSGDVFDRSWVFWQSEQLPAYAATSFGMRIRL